MTGSADPAARPATPEDLTRLLALASACVRASAPRKGYAHPGDIVWREFGPRPAPPDPEDARVWPRQDSLAAYAVFEPPSQLEFLLYPGAGAPALTAEVVAWAEQRRAAAEAEAPLTTAVLAGDPERASILGRLGFAPAAPAGTLFAYRLDRPLPAPLLTARARLRHATDRDIEARADLHRSAWSVWGPSSATAENYRRMRGAPLYDEVLDVVVDVRGQLLSYCLGWADPESGTGLLEPVGTRRHYTGQGYARAAIAEALYRLRARGLHTAYVGTAAVNERALALYSAFGFEPVEAAVAYRRA